MLPNKGGALKSKSSSTAPPLSPSASPQSVTDKDRSNESKIKGKGKGTQRPSDAKDKEKEKDKSGETKDKEKPEKDKVKASEVKDKANETHAEDKGKAHETHAEDKGKAHETHAEDKGKAHETKYKDRASMGEVKEKVQSVKSSVSKVASAFRLIKTKGKDNDKDNEPPRTNSVGPTSPSHKLKSSVSSHTSIHAIEGSSNKGTDQNAGQSSEHLDLHHNHEMGRYSLEIYQINQSFKPFRVRSKSTSPQAHVERNKELKAHFEKHKLHAAQAHHPHNAHHVHEILSHHGSIGSLGSLGHHGSAGSFTGTPNPVHQGSIASIHSGNHHFREARDSISVLTDPSKNKPSEAANVEGAGAIPKQPIANPIVPGQQQNEDKVKPPSFFQKHFQKASILKKNPPKTSITPVPDDTTVVTKTAKTASISIKGSKKKRGKMKNKIDFYPEDIVKFFIPHAESYHSVDDKCPFGLDIFLNTDLFWVEVSPGIETELQEMQGGSFSQKIYDYDVFDESEQRIVICIPEFYGRGSSDGDVETHEPTETPNEPDGPSELSFNNQFPTGPPNEFICQTAIGKDVCLVTYESDPSPNQSSWYDNRPRLQILMDDTNMGLITQIGSRIVVKDSKDTEIIEVVGVPVNLTGCCCKPQARAFKCKVYIMEQQKVLFGIIGRNGTQPKEILHGKPSGFYFYSINHPPPTSTTSLYKMYIFVILVGITTLYKEME